MGDDGAPADRLAETHPILWDKINEVLPTGQDPKSRAVRKALFKEMDKDGKRQRTHETHATP